uniref:Uncharacterized protein n=1 Tax=Populus alba TaxID=43335 RepID=A0A4U5PNX2_POPAL|nr:hypothetical protein D5086_0000198140 [Populus alba]
MLGSGGKVTLGRPGIVSRLGSGGSVGLGKEGCVVGNVGCGSAGIEGIGCNVGLGKLGTEGKWGNCRSCRAASPPEIDRAMKRTKTKQLKLAISMLNLKAWKRLYELAS